MRVDLAEPLAPHGGKVTIAMDYSFAVPEHGSDRMARDGPLYEIAQWYPRVAVYDDVRGWNTDQYLGQGEFYLEYGDIDFAVTVPAGYVVAGSGVLQNPQEVLSAAQRSRLAAAAHSDTVIRIITEAEAKPVAAVGHEDVALPRAARSRRGVGRRARFSVGRDELERRADAGVLRVAEGGRGVESGRRGNAVDDPDVLAARSSVPVSAGDIGGRPGGRNGISDVRVGALRVAGDRPDRSVRHASITSTGTNGFR